MTKMIETMKRNLLILGAAAIISACTAITPDQGMENARPSSGKDNGVTFVSAALENPVEAGADGKTCFGPASGSQYSVNWTDTDAIQINGCNSTSITVDGENAQQARFAIGGVVNYPYCAVYPASAASDYNSADGTATVTIPAVQTYTPGSFDPAAGVMLGYAASGAVDFHNAMAYLKVTVSGGSNSSAIKSVRVRANVTTTAGHYGRQPFSGEFVATFSGEGCTLSRDVNDGTSITLDCGAGVAQGTAMILAIPAQVYPDGINLFIVSADDKWQEVISTKSFTAESGVMYNTGVAFNGDGGAYEGIGIYTVNDWNALTAQYTYLFDAPEFKDANDTINLYNDLSATSLFRLGAGTEAGTNSTFDGKLQGHGHTLTTTAQSVPLLTYVTGTIRNLNIAGNKATMAKAGWGTCMLALEARSGSLIEGVTANYSVDAAPAGDEIIYYYGLFRNILSGATVRGCIQKSNFILNPQDATTKDWVVVPISYSNEGEVYNCANEGNITCTAVLNQKVIAAPFYKTTNKIDGFVNTGNFTIQTTIGGASAGVSVMGGGMIRNAVNGVKDYGSTKGVIDYTVAPTANGRAVRLGGIAAYGDGSSASSCGRFYYCTNYGNIRLYKSTGKLLYRSCVGGIVGDIRYGAYTSSESNQYCTLDHSSNHGYLTVYEPSSESTGETACPLFLGGLIGCALNSSGTSSGAIIFSKPSKTTTKTAGLLNGVFVVVRKECSNTGTLEMASASVQPSASNGTGARINYVGGLAGFTYGLQETASSSAHYAVLRGTQNGIIKVGSYVTGCIASGGIVGGTCYSKVENASATVDLQATTLLTNDNDPRFRGTAGAVIGFAVKHSNIGGASSPVNGVLTDNTGLNCSASLVNTTSLIGYSGITGAQSVNLNDTVVTHELKVYGHPTYNGATIVVADLYGTGKRTIVE